MGLLLDLAQILIFLFGYKDHGDCMISSLSSYFGSSIVRRY